MTPHHHNTLTYTNPSHSYVQRACEQTALDKQIRLAALCLALWLTVMTTVGLITLLPLRGQALASLAGGEPLHALHLLPADKTQRENDTISQSQCLSILAGG